jgi:transcriptional regulator with XRE-family HTH domain
VTPDRDQVLSEFIDAWNAGQRPDVDDYLIRVPDAERAELADQLVMFLSVAPTPEYSDDALAAIRADPIVAGALGAPAERGGLLPSLLGSLRERFSLSTPQLAAELVRELELPDERASKTASYLDQLERGQLEPSRISRKVFDALARLFGVPSDELEGAGNVGSWATPSPAPAFRAEDDAAQAAAPHLDLLAKGLATPGGAGRDEVDDLFLGGR